MLDTTGFANGYDTINVTAVDQSSQPLPTATGQGSLLSVSGQCHADGEYPGSGSWQ